VISINKNKGYVLSFVLLFILLTGSTAMASGGSEGWRETYDLAMKWINFGILIVLFIKFAKTPLMNFLNTQSESLSRDIKRLEEAKKKSQDRSKEIAGQLADRQSRVDSIKEKIIQQGAKEKEKIVKDAKGQSHYMLEDARKRMASQVLQAKIKLQSELVDEVISLAMERLPREITDADNNALLGQYFSAVEEQE